MKSIAVYNFYISNKIVTSLFLMMMVLNLISFTKYSHLIPGVYLLKYISFFSFILILVGILNERIKRVRITYLLILNIILIAMLPSILNTTYSTIGSSVLLILVSFTIAFSSLFIFPNIKKELFLKLLKIMFVVIACIVIVPNFILTFNSSNFYLIGYRTRFIGFFNNANELARFTALGFLIGIRIIPFVKVKLYKIIILLLIIISIYIIYLTNSRASLLLCLISIVLLFSIWSYKKGNKLISIFILSILFIISVSIIFSEIPSLGFDAINELSSGRLSIWKNILSDKSKFELIFGSGSERSGITANLVVTNGYFEILLYYGIIGLILWIGLIMTLLIKKIMNIGKGNIIKSICSISIIISFLAYYMFEGGLISVGNIASIYFWIELSQKEI